MDNAGYSPQLAPLASGNILVNKDKFITIEV